jgi:tellurite methyltransferase
LQADRSKWNERYREKELLHGSEPSRFLAEWLPRIMALTSGRRALDIACGEGRNSLFLARHGFRVTGLDIADVALAKARRLAGAEGLDIDFRLADLEGYVFDGSFDLIVNCNFLLRELFPKGVAALSAGGLLLVDTILDSPLVAVPCNKQYLLQPGELAKLFTGLAGTIICSEELPGEPTPTARLLFRKGE